jgi:hypothetical protein
MCNRDKHCNIELELLSNHPILWDFATGFSPPRTLASRDDFSHACLCISTAAFCFKEITEEYGESGCDGESRCDYTLANEKALSGAFFFYIINL